MSISSTAGRIVKRYFFSGLLVVVPLIITYLVLKFLFQTIDNILQPLILQVFEVNIPGLGLILTILIVILAGLVTHNYLGGKLYRLWEKILARVPLVRPIYSAAKQLLESTTQQHASAFKEVVMIEFPRKGSFVVCFVAHFLEFEIDGVMRKCACVFVPNPPTPFTGAAVILPIEDIIAVDMTIEQGVKFLVSGGVAAPDKIRRKGTLQWSASDEVNYEAR
jgi:uncharacterized membrane protein